MAVGLLILGLVLFIFLVVAHEFGHFMVARRNGVQIEEFGIGFPPRIWSRKTKKGYLFSINWLPLGGFVKLKGENDADESKGSLGAASLWSKSKILLAGVAMNLIVCFVLLTIIAIIGMPQLVANQFTIKTDTTTTGEKVLVGYIEPKSPAASIGLKSSDQLEGIGLSPNALTPVKNADGLPAITKTYAGETVYIRYDYSGLQYTKKVTLRSAKAVNASYDPTTSSGQTRLSGNPTHPVQPAKIDLDVAADRAGHNEAIYGSDIQRNMGSLVQSGTRPSRQSLPASGWSGPDCPVVKCLQPTRLSIRVNDYRRHFALTGADQCFANTGAGRRPLVLYAHTPADYPAPPKAPYGRTYPRHWHGRNNAAVCAYYYIRVIEWPKKQVE